MGSWRTGARTRRRIAYPARMPPRFDLQSHSTHSDGELSAAEVVERAAKAGVELLALTDHDTVTGVSEALEAGKRFGVHVVPAVEISSIDDGAQAPRELHILGYAIDHAGGRQGSVGVGGVRLQVEAGWHPRQAMRSAQKLA